MSWQAFCKRHRAYALLHRQRLRRLVDESVALARMFSEQRGAPLMLSFSGGKDSVLMHHIVTNVANLNPVTVWFARPSFPPTLDMVREFKCRFVQIHQFGGFEKEHGAEPQWSNRPAMDAEIYDYRDLDTLWGIQGTFVGIRRDESVTRRYALVNEIIEAKTYSGGWRCAPIAAWRTPDIWAYTIANKLPVNRQYVDMIDAGAPEELLRVASIGALFSPELPADQSRAFLRQLYPEAFNAFLQDNPQIVL